MFDVAIIGCGIIGAAAAYELSKYNLSLAVIESNNDVADSTTKANSAILHAGYDPHPGTFMAWANVEGVRLAKEICHKLDVPYKQCDSMVLAFSEQEMNHVRELFDRGTKNGVPGLQIIDGDQARKLEPNLSEEVVGSLLAPSAAIVCPWEYGLALAETAVRNGAELFLNSPVTAIEKIDGGYRMKTPTGDYEAKYVINAAGHNCAKIHNMVAEPEFEITYGRGEYYLLDKSEGTFVTRTIFQCPNELGKGVLVSPTVHGNLIVGPNSETVADGEIDGTTSAALDFIAQMARKSAPTLNLRQSIRNFAGVRTSAVGLDDFIVQETKTAKNFIDLAGIKSPGLSSAPAIAIKAREILEGCGLKMVEKAGFIDERKRVRFKEMSVEEKAELVKKNPAYGRIICRCETITEGEILDALNTPIPPTTVDAVKRRCNAGMGRCQGGFCGPRVLEILSRERGVDPTEVLQGRNGTQILIGQTKKGEQ